MKKVPRKRHKGWLRGLFSHGWRRLLVIVSLRGDPRRKNPSSQANPVQAQKKRGGVGARYAKRSRVNKGREADLKRLGIGTAKSKEKKKKI